MCGDVRLLEINNFYALGFLLIGFLLSLMIGFFLSLGIGISYYRFRWREPRNVEEDNPPDIAVYERFANIQLDLHIITERLLPSPPFYYLVGLITVLCLLIFTLAVL
ncbi:MAG: hypothetical protein ACFFAJ_14685 [Candidatus Hodarchaeota archaeon]